MDKKTRFVRKDKKNNFTVIDNTFLKRSEMTLRAKGLLAYLLSLPDDWLVHKKELYNNHKEGYSASDTAFEELKKFGYINYYQIRDSSGRFGSWICEIYEDPNENLKFTLNDPDRDFPELDKPKSENLKPGKTNLDKPMLDNQNLQSTYSTNNLLYKELKELIDDEDYINKRNRIINRLNKAGIKNITNTKLQPIVDLIRRLSSDYKMEYKEIEKIILLSIDFFELNEGRSISYLATIYKDWEYRSLNTYDEIKDHTITSRNKNGEHSRKNLPDVPLYNFLEDL